MAALIAMDEQVATAQGHLSSSCNEHGCLPKRSTAKVETAIRAAVPDHRDGEYPEGRRHGHTSCAVVGSGPNLRDRRLGTHIDAHDVVIRFNAAPVAGYELDVGAKTTVRVAHMKASGRVLSEQSAWDVLQTDDWGAHSDRWDVMEDLGDRWLGAGCPDVLNTTILAQERASDVCIELAPLLQAEFDAFRAKNAEGLWALYQYPDSSFNLAMASQLASHASRRQRKLSMEMEDFAGVRVRVDWGIAPERLALLAPQLVAHARDVWGRARFGTSTGFVGVVLGMYMCDVVDVYGFNPYANTQRWHYWNTPSPPPVERPAGVRAFWHEQIHNTGREKQLLEMLEADGVIRNFTPAKRWQGKRWK